METTLYEFSFNFAAIVGLIFPLLISIVLFFANEIVRECKGSKTATPIGAKEISPKTFKIFTRILGGFLTVCCLLFMILHITEYKEYKTRLDNDDVFVIEGYVTNYKEYSTIEKTPESFEIDGVCFAYSERDETNGYHSIAGHGGVITHNGQHLKIKYVTNEWNENVILAIYEIK